MIPYVGLRRFEMEDNRLFFGRDDEISDLLRRLETLHFIAIVGPSGSGKSSVVRAGLLAELRDGYMADGGKWKIVELQPGNGPLEAWREKLQPHLKKGIDPELLSIDPAKAVDVSDGPIVILVDQFEELFLYGKRTGRERDVRAFLDVMLATGANESGIYLVLTMRSEYLSHCAQYPKLAEAINEGLYLLPQMTRDQLRDAIIKPVRVVGEAITAPLVDRLLNDTVGENDPLPLLQHALMRMWAKKRQWEPLGLAEYEAGRGLGAFLNDHAESVYSRLDDGSKKAAEALFRTITELTDDGRAVRRATELIAIAAEARMPEESFRPVIQAFGAEGLVFANVSTRSPSPLIDIAHEAVARNWNRLREWMEAEALHRSAVKRVRERSDEWEANGRKGDYLLRGKALENVVRQVDETKLDGRPQAFLRASRRAEFIRSISLKVIAPLLALMIVSGFVLYEFRSQLKLSTNDGRRFEQTLIAARERQSASTEVPRETTIAPDAQPNAKNYRVYIQIVDEQQRDTAIRCKRWVENASFKVPGIELVRVGPPRNEVRYFRTVDKEEAEAVRDVMVKNKLPAVATYVPGFEDNRTIRTGHLEVWFAAPSGSTGGAW